MNSDRKATVSIASIWPPRHACAVTLTYDDGLAGHALKVAPALADLALPATFFVPIESDLIRSPDRWRHVSELGHELGNHTVFHPCHKSCAEDRSWVEPCFDLADYTESRLRRELSVASGVLGAIDGRRDRTYGNTCFETTFGPSSSPTSMMAVLRPLFVAARGALRDAPVRPGPGFDPYNVGTIDIDGRSFEQLLDLVETARAAGGWVVLTAHGVGPGEHAMYVEEETHWRFARWLSRQADVWVATFIDVARAARAQEPHIVDRADPVDVSVWN